MSNSETKMISIGKITSSVGIKGEVRVTLYGGESDNLKKGVVLTLENRKSKMECKVENVRYQGGRPVVKFAEVADRNAADELRDFELSIPEAELAELAPGEFYIKDLIGFEAYDKASETVIGEVTDYIRNTAQCLWEITTQEGKQVLVPDVDAFVKEIKVEERTLVVELIPGFLD